MSRIVTIKVTPIYHFDSGRTRCMSSYISHVAVPPSLSKRYLAYNGRILRSLHYFSRFEGFSTRLVDKICFRLELIEQSNHQSYVTTLPGCVALLHYCLL